MIWGRMAPGLLYKLTSPALVLKVPPPPPIVEIGSAIPSSPRFPICFSEKALILYTLTSVFIFSTLLSVHLLRCCQGEFV